MLEFERCKKTCVVFQKHRVYFESIQNHCWLFIAIWSHYWDKALARWPVAGLPSRLCRLCAALWVCMRFCQDRTLSCIRENQRLTARGSGINRACRSPICKEKRSFMRKMVKRAAVALCLGVLLVAQAQAQPASLPPVRIALIESLSGAFANAGEAMFRSLV